MASLDTVPKLVVIGAGPVGCLAAIALAKQGWSVEIYEGRADMRTPGARVAAQQRSINLAISARGITALQSILGPEAAADVLKDAIPMHGRMIHDVRGRLESQKYDRHGQSINSLDRAILNETLLAHASAMPGICIFFRHKVQAIDFDNRIMTALNQESNLDIRVAFDLCIGADGSYSVVRRQMQRVVRMDYEQKYIPHEYIELKMPPRTVDGQDVSFKMDPHHLHIWPRSSFMLIALPNKDRSFTCTLFAPTANFDQLAAVSRDERRKWFSQQFPDALDLIGADRLLDDLEHNPRGALISIKTDPYHYKDCGILLGDAAHAMVPFYGQGLNCGLEDVRVLEVLLRQEGVPTAIGDPKTLRSGMSATLSRYSHERHEDLVAICDLAMQNYTEMRHDVATPSYLFRRVVDNVLQALTTSAPSPPNAERVSSSRAETLSYTKPKGESLASAAFAAEPFGWLPLYTMVTFQPYLGYAAAQRRARRQTMALAVIEGIALIGAAAAVGWGAWAARGRLR